jgi:hypothetical protein
VQVSEGIEVVLKTNYHIQLSSITRPYQIIAHTKICCRCFGDKKLIFNSYVHDLRIIVVIFVVTHM